MKSLSDKEFKSRFEQGEEVENAKLRKQFACDEIKAIDREARTIDFVISTEDPDRMDDVIKVNGWELDSYKKNPVVLFAHDNSEPPVAKANDITIRPRKKQLTARAEFVPQDVSPFAESLFQLYDKGFMRATSVGFRPIEFQFSDEDNRPMGIDFTRTELLEFSLVPVPANPEALISAKKDGIDMKPMVTWAERVLDDWGEYKNSGLHVPRRTVEHLYKECSNDQNKTHSLPMKDQLGLLRRNMDKIMDQIDGKSKEEEYQMSTKDDKGAVSWQRAHPDGTPKADKDETWDGGDVEDALPNDVEDNIDLFERVYAFHEGDEPPTTKGPWKLPHHKADGDNAVVWHGVANAAARLPQTDMPDEEVPGVQEHLGRHYEEFDETPPWDDQEDAATWKAYVEACKSMREDAEQFDEAKSLCERLFGEDITKALFSDEVRKELFGEEKGSDNDISGLSAQISVDSEDVKSYLEERIGAIKEELSEKYDKEIAEEKARINAMGLFDVASKFLETIDESIEKESIPEPSRQDKRVLRDVVESLNELCQKMGDEKLAFIESKKDKQFIKSSSTKSSVDDEDEIELTDEEVEEILDSENINELISETVEREFRQITGQVD